MMWRGHSPSEQTNLVRSRLVIQLGVHLTIEQEIKKRTNTAIKGAIIQRARETFIDAFHVK